MTRPGLPTRIPIPGPLRPAVAAIALLVIVVAGCDSQGGAIIDYVPPATTRLTAPTNGSNDTENAVELVWSAAEPGAIYELIVSSDPAFEDVIVQIQNLQKPSFVLTGLEVGQEYRWKVRASNPAGTGPWSSEWTFTPSRAVVLAGVPQPAWPPHDMINLPTVVTVQWMPTEGALSYDLQVAQEDVFIRRDADMTGVETPYSELGFLVYGYEYFWRVRSRNHAGVSAWSPVWRFVVERSDDPFAPS